jgi:hypothetical protein
VLLKLGNHEYKFTRGSDVIRDGMFVEAEVVSPGVCGVVAEIFYSDSDGKFSVSCFEENVPLEVIEYIIAEGRRWLPPSKLKQ